MSAGRRETTNPPEHWLDGLAKRLARRASRRSIIVEAGAAAGAFLASYVLRRAPRAEAYGLIQCTPGSGTAQCPPSTTCIAGLCLQPFQTSYCPPGFSYCYGQCINTQTDPNHCGGCNVQCPFGVPCTFGACTIVFEPAAPGPVVGAGTPGAVGAPVCTASTVHSAAGPDPSVTVSGNGRTFTAAAMGPSGQITLTLCASNPGPTPPPGITDFIDLRVGPGSSFTSVTLTICLALTPGLVWLSPAGGWQPVSPVPVLTPPRCQAMVFNADQLVGDRRPHGYGAGRRGRLRGVSRGELLPAGGHQEHDVGPGNSGRLPARPTWGDSGCLRVSGHSLRGLLHPRPEREQQLLV